MHKWTKTAGLLFFAAASVYSGPANAAGEDSSVKPDATPDVKLLGDGNSDLFATPATQPTDPPPSDKPGLPPKVIMTDAGTFSIQINNDISLVEVLRMIGNQAQISIIPSKEVRGTVPAMDLYNVTVHEALDAILHSNGMGYKQKGNFVYVYSQHELAEIDKANRVTNTEVFHLYYTPAGNAVNMIKPVLSGDAQVSFSTPAASGIASGTGDVGGNSHAIEDLIVVTDYPENLDKARKIIKEVDRRPQQILVEATILRASLTEDNDLGIDFTILGGTDFATIMNPAGAATTAGNALTGNILNTPTAGGLINNGYAGGGTSFSTQIPQGGLKLGVVHNNLAFFLQALESVTDTTVLANPKVLALDKQRGEVIVGRKDGYLTTTTTQTTSTQTVEFLETGTRLVFRPFVGDDGYIRMEIHPEDSSGGLTSANLPFKITTEVTSNVMVKDGNTIVIGGLFRESSQVSRAQVPFLGSLPLVGPLFRQQQDSTQREEIIILLTPHIVKDDAAYSKASENELKELEKLRVGTRKEMMFFGRERLAESAYECAEAEMNKPHPDVNKALWHLDCATNLNPRFIEALDLKEKLTGKTVTDVDNSVIRNFVRAQIIAERASIPTTFPSGPTPAGNGVELSPRSGGPTAATLPPTPPITTPPVTTQPTVAQLTPTTRPIEAVAPATMPGSQPAVVDVPATQPSVAVAPTTQPTAAVAPATQPDAVITTTTAPVEVRVIEDSDPVLATQPTTRPMADDHANAKTVTEIPIEPEGPSVPTGR